MIEGLMVYIYNVVSIRKSIMTENNCYELEINRKVTSSAVTYIEFLLVQGFPCFSSTEGIHSSILYIGYLSTGWATLRERGYFPCLYCLCKHLSARIHHQSIITMDT